MIMSKFDILGYGKNYVLIQDKCDDDNYYAMSVTNDAENVVRYLMNIFELKGKRIFYIDTDGRVDELEHDGEKFTGFKFGYDNLNIFLEHNGGIDI